MSEKGKKFQKISIFAAVVMLIGMVWGVSVMADTSAVVYGDSCYAYGDIVADGKISEDDAIYLLYNSVFGEEAYPLTNYESDGEITALDALALLDLEGNEAAHAYKDPIWQWTEDGEAKAVFHCACGKGDALVKEATITTKETKATCISEGIAEYKATVELFDKTYTADKTVQTSPATGIHTYASDVVCSDRTCTVENCGHVEAASAHVYEVVQTTTATCTEAATKTYKCSACNEATYEETVGLAAGHAYGAAVETHVAGCEYKEVYTCGTCKNSVDGKEYSKHEEVASIKEEATCSHTGTKVYACKTCKAETKSETIEKVADAHTWTMKEGTDLENDAVIEYTCTCNATRTAINAAKKTEAKVDSTVLAETSEIDLNGTSLKLDAETVEQLKELEGDVELKAEQKTASELELTVDLTDEQKEQIGNNPVYDFSFTDKDGNDVEFTSMTITLPYTLQEGDDVDCIDVWYIADDGTVKAQQGTYANGQVTFTATHFSYYTVTRLTPAERCKQYGHNDATSEVKATCTTGGYTLHVCARCNETWKTNEVAALGHTLSTETTAATCTKAGKSVVTCANCDYKSTSTTPATGHKWKETTESATCAGTKTVSVGCANTDCTATKEITLAQLPHDTTTTSVAATCEERAYDLTKCNNCTYELKEYTGTAKGHVYAVTWAWDKEAHTATATFACTTDGCKNSFVKDKDVTVTITKELPTSCEKDGYRDYLAKVVYNSKVYSSEYTEVIPATGHNVSAAWSHNALQHYHVCTLCDAKLEAADHTLDSTITKEATCTEEGTKLYTCTVCGYSKTEAIPATGHSYGDDHICDNCGHSNLVCDHKELRHVDEEFSTEDGYCGGTFSYEVCECGEVKYFVGYDFRCVFDYEEEVEIDENGYAKYVIEAGCDKCGLHLEEVDRWVIDEDTCTGTQYMDTVIYDKNDEEIFTFSGINEEIVAHPNAVYGEPDELDKYGMCDGTVTHVSCPCGQDEMLLMDITCYFVEVPDKCGEGIYVAECMLCGTEVVNKYGSEELGQCDVYYAEEYTFYKDGKELVSYDYGFRMAEHDSDFTFELEGDTCSDGYTVHQKCKVCGFENIYFEQTNPGAHWTYPVSIDVSEYDLCVDELIGWACPCGEYASLYNIYEDHDWTTLNYEEVELNNGYKNVVTQECDDCGLTRDYVETVTNTENDCEVMVYYTCDYSVSGAIIYTENEKYVNPSHNYEVIGSQLRGDSCVDGVDLTVECLDCGLVTTDRIYYHESIVKESYNAADYGMCAGEIIVYACACGEEGNIYEGNACRWEQVGYDETTNTEIYECSVCEMIQYCSYTENSREGCITNGTLVYEYVKGTTVVLTIELETRREVHDFEYTFEIETGASCEDGYIISMICKDCDAGDSWFTQTNPGEHERYLKETYDMSEYGLCDGYVYLYECPCGASAGINWRDNGCDWQWFDYDEETETTIYKCVGCGGMRHYQEEEISAEGCYAEYVVTNTFFDKTGEEVLRVAAVETYGMHNFDIAFDIKDGATCTDGYTIIYTCKDCDGVFTEYEEMPEGQHMRYRVATYDLKDFGYCGGEIEVMSCACGASKNYYWNEYDTCNFVREEDNNAYTCTECGGSYISGWDIEEIDSCHEKEISWVDFYSPEGKHVFSVEYIDIYDFHNDIATFEFNGESCEDGYIVTLTCQVCGDVRTRTGFDHDTYCVETEDLSDTGICGGDISHYRCACGEYTFVWSNQDCSWTQTNYDNQTDTMTYTCTKCGAVKTEAQSVSEKDADCMIYRTTYYTVTNQDGVKVAEYSTSYSTEQHNFTYTFIMQGTSCEDGYYTVQTCQDCGETHQDSILRVEHINWCVESVDLADKGLCGGILRQYRCACGENNNWGIMDQACEWQWYEMDSSICNGCGTVRAYTSQSQTIDACHDKYMEHVTYSKDGVEVYSYDFNYISEHHDAVYTLELKNSNGNCYDGYIATGVCDVCHENVRYEGYEHANYVVEKEDLSDDGLCQGTVVKKYACACGANEHVSDSVMDAGCNWSHYGATGFSYEWEYDVISAEAYFCYDYASNGSYTCGAVKQIAEAIVEKDANCNATIATITVYYNAQGELVYVYEDTYYGERHSYKFTGEVVLNDPTDCEAGGYATYVCEDCGIVDRSYFDWHEMKTQVAYELSEYGACAGAYVEKYGCYCGENQYVNYSFPGCIMEWSYNDYTDDNGVTHSVNIWRCDDCDLMFKQDTVLESDIENCMETAIHTYTITVKNTAVGEPIVVENTYGDHSEFEVTATLADGATNCEEGVIINRQCKYCDYGYQEMYNWHQTIPVNEYDLADYGSVCGGKVVEYACACGDSAYLNLEDVECDMDMTHITTELEYEGQETTDGRNNYWRYEYIRKCAVTSPECGFAIYETDYHEWDEENCAMISYTSWKLGYDDVTGNCVKELVTETGRNAYHAYEVTTSADGYTTTGVCKHCGSSYVDSSVYDANDNLIYNEKSSINTLDNGEPLSRSEINEYVINMGYSYQVKDYYDIVYANGNAWWIHYDYEYDWSNCSCVRTMTDSYGATEVSTTDGHKGTWSWVVVEEPTCSQPGLGQYVKDCPVCGTTVKDPTSEIAPSHNWGWTEAGIYVCVDCGLENVNGADGSIIFEDMSAEYGNGTDYVIGYYQRNNVRFSYELLVVLGEHEIPLTNISYVEMTKDADGITAIRFNKAEAEAAAIAALEAKGVTNTDGFALRFVFIPDSSDGDFDYAITLTDESIAQ